MKFDPERNGHFKNMRKAVVEMGLVDKDKLVYMADWEVVKTINRSDFLVFRNGDDFILAPKELEDKLIVIAR